MNRRSFNFLSPVFAGLLLAACANQPVPPDWLLTARTASEQHARLYLEGRDRLARSQLQIAREAASRTGDARHMARIELHACAAAVASLYRFDCPAFSPLAEDADPDATAYFRYLAGQMRGQMREQAGEQSNDRPGTADLPRLPPAQQTAWKKPERLADIPDPLSRLVAAAVLLQAGRLPPQGVQIAIDTASAQGWRRPLANWLRLEEERLQRQGDAAAAAAVARQLERVLSHLPADAP
jgi:hypothetical protein